ncbi:NfeD family protein [Candidatus Bealeia paramacronuclearis]|uniref:NfeD family protein n=1 Tax=Candidatus Bealeia paramacronuclearis TaxID=1921001 RepID=UPI002F26A41B
MGKRYKPSLKDDSDYPNLNDRGAQYVGQVFVLSKAIVDGRGKAKVGDTEWIVIGPDLPQGAQVKITGVEGTFLKVKPAD